MPSDQQAHVRSCVHLCALLCVCVCVRARVCFYVHTVIQLSACLPVCTHVFMCSSVLARAFLCPCLHECARALARVSVCMPTCPCVCTETHDDTPGLKGEVRLNGTEQQSGAGPSCPPPRPSCPSTCPAFSSACHPVGEREETPSVS